MFTVLATVALVLKPTFGTPGGTFKCFDKQCVKIAGDRANVGSPKASQI
jgi:hypothetical protein